MTINNYDELIGGIKAGKIIPYLGPGVLKGVTHGETGQEIPAPRGLRAKVGGPDSRWMRSPAVGKKAGVLDEGEA